MKRFISLVLSITMVILCMPMLALPAAALEIASVELVSLPTRSYYVNDSLFRGPWDLNGCAFKITFSDSSVREINCSEDLYAMDGYDYTNYGFFSGEYSELHDDNSDMFYISYEDVKHEESGLWIYDAFNLYLNYLGQSYFLGTIDLEDLNLTYFALNQTPENDRDLVIGSTYDILYGDNWDDLFSITINENMITNISYAWYHGFEYVEEVSWDALRIDNDKYAIIDYDSRELVYMCHCASTRNDSAQIRIEAEPKTDYYEGESLDLTGGTIRVEYIDGSEEIVPMTEDMITGFSTDVAGQNYVKVVYGSWQTEYMITVRHNFIADGDILRCSTCGVEIPVIDHIELIQAPSRTYYIGDPVFGGRPVDLTDCIVDVYYADGTSARADCNSINDWFYTEEYNYPVIGSFSGNWPSDSEDSSEFYFFDWVDNGDNTVDLYINTLATRLYVCTIEYVESDVIGLKIDESVSMYDSLVGSVFTIDYSDGSSREITVSDDMVVYPCYTGTGYYNGFGTQELTEWGYAIKVDNDYIYVNENDGTANYMGYECDVYSEAPAEIFGANVFDYPKTEYLENEPLDLSGGTIEVYYSDGTTAIVPMTNEMICNDVSTANAGYAWVDLSYEGINLGFSININHDFHQVGDVNKCSVCGLEIPLVDHVELIKAPERTYYLQDTLFNDSGFLWEDQLRPFDLSGCIVDIYYADGSVSRVDCDRDLLQETDDASVMSVCGFIGGSDYHDSRWVEDKSLVPEFFFFDWNRTGENSVDLFINNLGSRLKVCTIEYMDSNVDSIEIVNEHADEIKEFKNVDLRKLVWVLNGYQTFEGYICEYTQRHSPDMPYTCVETANYYEDEYGNKSGYIAYYDASVFEEEVHKYFDISSEELKNALPPFMAFYDASPNAGICYDSDRDAYGFYIAGWGDGENPCQGKYGYIDNGNNQYDIYFEHTESLGWTSEIPNSGVEGYDYVVDYDDYGNVMGAILYEHLTILLKVEYIDGIVKFISIDTVDSFPSDESGIVIYPSEQDYKNALIGSSLKVTYSDNSIKEFEITENSLTIPWIHNSNYYGGGSGPLSYYGDGTLIKIGNDFAVVDSNVGFVDYLGKIIFMGKEAPILSAHKYDVKVIDDAHLKSAATCLNKAVYYYGCTCGAVGTETFEYGSLSDHSWDDGVVTTAPTCTEEGVRTLTCTVCGETKTEPIAMIDHIFDQQVVSSEYLASAATCTSPATYYYSCSCGEKGTETFEYGSPSGHTFDCKVISDKYLASAATDTSPAIYYYSCACGEKGTETFEYNLNEVITVTDESSYVIAGNNIQNIQPGTSLDSFLEEFENEETSLRVFKEDGTEITSDTKLVGTGCVLKLFKGDTLVDSKVLIVTGDNSSDGKVTSGDVKKALNHTLGKTTLDGVYKLATDVDQNNRINSGDVKKILNFSLGKVTTF